MGVKECVYVVISHWLCDLADILNILYNVISFYHQLSMHPSWNGLISQGDRAELEKLHCMRKNNNLTRV